MPVWEWSLLAVLLVIVVAGLVVAATLANSRRKTKRLKEHYGSEYERLVNETGDHKRAENELLGRERNRDRLDIVALSPAALSDFTARWQQVQTGFVDNPASAVADAD